MLVINTPSSTEEVVTYLGDLTDIAVVLDTLHLLATEVTK